ncbi:MAG TPA: efflux RND transporter periplasmic adaptor subunit [Steroidobacteraceae bacterium]|nr:efflux RND transporter periplasmic adaptor subunit [Steroidobacteraceae bacterium]
MKTRHGVKAAFVAFGFAMAVDAANSPAQEAVPVQIAPATVQTVSPRSWIPGSIVSRSDARIASLVGGRVVWVAEVGQRVKAGAPIARLDDTVIRLQSTDLEAQVTRARAQRELARSQLERYNQLAATHVLSASQLEEARAQVSMTDADVTRAESQLRRAQHDIEESRIRAPFAGIVTERFIQQGEFVAVGAATVRLVNTGDIEARATASLDLASNIKPGQTITVRDRDTERAGKVRTVVPVGDDRSRQFEVRVTFEKSDWLVGTPIEVSLPTAPERKAMTVPRDALMIRANRSYVLRVTRKNTVEELIVTPGITVADLVEVRGALSAGDRLVIRGGERLSDGQAVKIVTEEALAAPHRG